MQSPCLDERSVSHGLHGFGLARHVQPHALCSSCSLALLMSSDRLRNLNTGTVAIILANCWLSMQTKVSISEGLAAMSKQPHVPHMVFGFALVEHVSQFDPWSNSAPARLPSIAATPIRQPFSREASLTGHKSKRNQRG